MMKAKISRKVPLNRGYLCHVCGWNIKNVSKDGALNICDPQTSTFLPFLLIHLQPVSSAESHLNERTSLICCVPKAVSGIWSSVTTHWLHWDLRIRCILTFDYYLLKKSLKPASRWFIACPFRGFQSASPWFKFWFYVLVKQKNSYLKCTKFLFNPVSLPH